MKTADIKLLLLAVPVSLGLGYFFLRPKKQSEKSTNNSLITSSPNWKISRIGRVSNELEEISGWEFISDSTLAAINDSGNEPIVFVVDTLGNILHRTYLTVENIDFEDVATDSKGHLYIGDIGNNRNTRKNLKIYQLDIDDLWKDTLSPKMTITYSYADQKSFPPVASERNFDAESFIWKDDSLLVFTKCRTIPFTGKSFCYKIPVVEGEHAVSPSFFVRTGMRSWLSDAVTAACIKGNTLFLLTQDRFIQYDFSGSIPERQSAFSILPLSQKESIAVNTKGTIYICDEKQKVIGGGTVFRIQPRK